MITLTIRTDKPEAEIGIFDGNKQVKYHAWQAHRELSETILKKIDSLLEEKGHKRLGGIIAYKGPGSFTGLRIGLSVANALADSLNIPIVSSTGEDWIQRGIERIDSGENEKQVLPEYGAPPHITKPKH
jgi:tRNA threonylcarbamoyladenosine biosynthesis protein TsaB